MIHWKAPAYKAGRRVAVSDQIEIGAVFPPCGQEKHWRWRFWLNGKSYPTEGKSASEVEAKKCLEWAWLQFLHSAGLRDAA